MSTLHTDSFLFSYYKLCGIVVTCLFRLVFLCRVVIEPVRVVSSFQRRQGSKLNKNRENEKSEKDKRERKGSDLGNRYFQEYLNSPYSYTSNALYILFLLLVWIALLAAYSYICGNNLK